MLSCLSECRFLCFSQCVSEQCVRGESLPNLGRGFPFSFVYYVFYRRRQTVDTPDFVHFISLTLPYHSLVLYDIYNWTEN
jgi:hypothetical protein